MQDIINHIKQAIKLIATELKYPDTSYKDSLNSTGDTQLKLDLRSDDIITNTLAKCDNIKALISEEKDNIQILNKNASFIVAFDPLDGSSLVDVGLSIGSIFAIYENELKAKNLKMAIYAIYGPRIEIVICHEKPKLYRLNNDEFVFIKDLTLNHKGRINACGGTQKYWDENHKNFIASLFDEGYRLRYSGAMVADLHHILCKGGGIFSYPATKDSPKGKLRAFFEVLPFALIFQKAGGKAINGEKNLLECEFDQIHESTPCFFGSCYEIDKLLKFKQ